MAATKGKKIESPLREEKLVDNVMAPNLCFVCVHCATPCSELYRKLSASSIKTMTCINAECQQIVDPYIEREWLLVAIDCILLRPEAYRHVLFNATKDFPLFETVTWGRAIRLTMVSNILPAYFQYESAMFLGSTKVWEKGIFPGATMIPLILASVFKVFLQWSAAYLYTSRASHCTIWNSPTLSAADLGAKLFLSLLLPTTFHVTTVFVLIWENSQTTRALGSLLVSCWQAMAVFLVANHVTARNGGRMASVVVIVAGMLWQLLLTHLPTIPQVGLELHFFFQGSEAVFLQNRDL
jgi:hypothetical protein